MSQIREFLYIVWEIWGKVFETFRHCGNNFFECYLLQVWEIFGSFRNITEFLKIVGNLRKLFSALSESFAIF